MEAELEKRWQKLGTEIGMTKDQALEQFRTWREKMKTCSRCEGEKYVDFCPVHLICKEATDYEQRNVEGDDHRDGAVEVDELETLRVGIFENRERNALR